MQSLGEEDKASYSDGEVDSDAEDNDAEKELGHWLEQLQVAGQVSYYSDNYVRLFSEKLWSNINPRLGMS